MRRLPVTLFKELLQDLPQREQKGFGDLAFVVASLEMQSEQRGNAIRATIVLANTGAHPIELLNPFDLLQWQLLDSAGAPLEVPSVPPNLAVHRPSSEPWKLGGAVPVVEVRLSGAPTNPTVVDTPTIELAPRIELAVTFGFEEIVENRGPAKIRSGEYSLGCLVTLIDSEQRSRIVGCNPLPVRFNA